MLYRGPWPLTHRQPSRPVPDRVGQSREQLVSIQGPGDETGGNGAVYRAAQPEEGHARGTGMTCAGRVAAVRIVACRPAGASSATEDVVLAVPRLLRPP